MLGWIMTSNEWSRGAITVGSFALKAIHSLEVRTGFVHRQAKRGHSFPGA